MKINTLIASTCLGMALNLVGIQPLTAQPPALPGVKTPVLAVGDDPRGAVAGDFNGDGKMDIATANQGDNNVSILLANAAGGFVKADKSPVKVGKAPRALAVGDFNGDKKLDLAVGNSGANNVSILLGDGTGQFAAAPGDPLKVGNRPIAVAVSDFDGNDKADLAVANNTSDSVSIMLGNGTGGFAEAPGSPFTVGKSPFFVAVSDLNIDGALDLVVANSGTNNVSVLLGKDGGTFGNKNDFAVGISPRSIAVSDFNGDNKADLAVANSGSNNVSLLLGNGDGKFNAKTDISVGPSPRSVVAGDFNNNGKADLAVTSYSANNVLVLLGDGAGKFVPATGAPIAVGSEPLWLVVADMNADLNLDLIVVNADSNDISVLKGSGMRGFKP